MPEGDSLHKLARALGPRLAGAEVVSLQLPRAPVATAGLSGQRVVGVEARGKNLLIHFDGGLALHVHLKMRGRVRYWPASQAYPPGPAGGSECVAELTTSRTCVGVFSGPVARLIRSRDVHRDLHFRHLGPDLLSPSADLEEAVRRLRGRRHLPLGVALMDQGAVAGIGNVWKSETCFNQRLDPFAPVAQFGDDVLMALLQHAREAMRQNVYSKPRTMPDPFSPPPWKRQARLVRGRTPVPKRMGEGSLSVYRRAGEPCYDCGGGIAVAYQGSPRRSTYFCPSCQAVLASGTELAQKPKP